MLAIGVDIEDISRFKNKKPEFLERIFTKQELDYCFKNKYPERHLAARFCAKEAVIKALSGLYQKTLPLKQIEILKNKNSAPYVNIQIEELQKYKIHLSISHEKEKAIAFVTVE